MTSSKVNPDNLSDFQIWVLFYFLRSKDSGISGEDLADNMCLTAIIDFDIKRVTPELSELQKKGLIKALDSTPRPSYTSTLEGRFYVKQKILAQLIRAKTQNKITELIAYLKRKDARQDLVAELYDALKQKEQSVFLDKISGIALRDIVPFLSLLVVVAGFFIS